MGLKNLWLKLSHWLKDHGQSAQSHYHINEHGLLHEHDQEQVQEQKPEENNFAVVKKSDNSDKGQAIEKLQDGFNRLINQLEGINEHLNRQTDHQEELMRKMDNIPKLVESFPAVVQNQKALTEELLDQLAKTAAKDQHFVDAVEKIPAETAKQTDALIDINTQLAASADTEVQMVENFNKFNDALNKLNQNTNANSDSISKMTRTFATSDRYMKYLMTKQSRQFRWLFVFTVGVCLLTILALIGIIIYLKQ